MRARTWGPPLIFAGHALDELASGFPEWATRHFGTTSRRFYLASHAALLAGVVVTAVAADRRRSDPRVQTAVAVIAAGFVANGLFHVETTRRFGEWSPGLLTAMMLMIPGGTSIFIEVSRGMGRRDVARALVGGTLLNAAAVASLRLDMPALAD